MKDGKTKLAQRLAIFGALAAGLAWSSAASAEDTIKIGILHSLS